MFPSARQPQPPPQGGGGGSAAAVERLRRRQHSHRPPGKNNNTGPKLYNPLIYSYKCRGMYHAASDANEGSEGICKGFRTKLEVLVDQTQQQQQNGGSAAGETMTRKEALKRFTTMTADFDIDEYSGDSASSSSSSDSNSELQQQAIFLSPALIYKDNNNNKSTNEKDGEAASADGNDKDHQGDDKNKKNSSRPPPVVNLLNNDSRLPEEELIKNEQWTCYGSTEVEYLVLQDIYTGEKKITAVAPRNTGISFREIETDDSVRSITRIGLGWLDIIHDNQSVYEEVVDDDNEQENKNINAQTNLPEEVPPRPGVDSIEVARQALQRTWEFSNRVLQHMYWNTHWLVTNVQDDFPHRTYNAGQKIVSQLPKTANQTFDTMTKIVHRLFNDDDDDDDDDNDHGGYGPPPPRGRGGGH